MTKKQKLHQESKRTEHDIPLRKQQEDLKGFKFLCPSQCRFTEHLITCSTEIIEDSDDGKKTQILQEILRS